MRKNNIIILGVLFILLTTQFGIAQTFATTNQQEDSFLLMAETNGPKLSFDKEFVDLGEVKKGEKRTLFYEMTNTGDEDLVIELVSACDCTTVTYPHKPIKPGETIKFDVVFDSSEKEESEDIDIDIFFTNIDPISEAPLIKTVKYHFDLLL